MSRRHGDSKYAFFKSPEGNISDKTETSSIKIDDIIHTATSIAVTTYVRRQRNNPKDEIPTKAVLFLCSY